MPVDHPDWRGRFLGRLNVQELPDGFTRPGPGRRCSATTTSSSSTSSTSSTTTSTRRPSSTSSSSRTTGPGPCLAEPRLRDWVTETEWLPRGRRLPARPDVLRPVHLQRPRPAPATPGCGPTEEPAFAYSPTDVRHRHRPLRPLAGAEPAVPRRAVQGRALRRARPDLLHATT